MAISVTPRLIIEAAKKRGWHVRIIDEDAAFYRIDASPSEYYYVRNITSYKSTAINQFIAARKDVFYQLADEMGIRIPDTLKFNDDIQEAQNFLRKHKLIVVKPSDQSHGDGITINITNLDELTEAIAYAQTFSPKVLLQQQVNGDDYRLLCIDNKLAAAAVRKPAYVVGDGMHTVAQLIEIENQNPLRSDGYNTALTTINVVDAARYLTHSIDVVPAKSEEIRVMGTSNIGKGGVAIDVTDTVDEYTVTTATKVVDHFGMGICGIDFLVAEDGTAYLNEVNPRPSLGLHEHPFVGNPQHTPDKFLDWLVKK